MGDETNCRSGMTTVKTKVRILKPNLKYAIICQTYFAGIYLYCDKEGCEFKTFYYRVLVQHKKKHDGLKQHVCEHCSYSTADVSPYTKIKRKF